MTAPRAVALLAVCGLLWLAPTAAAHSVMDVDGSTIEYAATDDVSLNDLSVTVVGDQLRFVDRGADGGIQAPNECTSGAVDTRGWIYEVDCPRAGMTALRLDVGEAQDRITAELALNIVVSGGSGADTILTGDGADTINGGAANDTIRSAGGNDQVVGEVGDDTLEAGPGDDIVQAALGVDTADGGPGNDDLRVRDGFADRAVCGDGNDRVQADDRDDVEAACETVDRQAGAVGPAGEPGGGPAPGPGGAPPAPDTIAPRLRAGGSTLQRVGATGRVVVLATASEAGELIGGGYVTVGEERLLLRSARAPLTVGGGGARLVLTLSRADARKLRRRIGRRRAFATISVVATDTAGNSASARLPRIKLRR